MFYNFNQVWWCTPSNRINLKARKINLLSVEETPAHILQRSNAGKETYSTDTLISNILFSGCMFLLNGLAHFSEVVFSLFWLRPMHVRGSP